MPDLKGSDPKDVELENTVSRALHGLVSDCHISALAGHVTISGKVDDFGAKRDIYLTVQSVAGVKTISNLIRVTPIGD
jgi:osmotically-inducible protein OsmY